MHLVKSATNVESDPLTKSPLLGKRLSSTNSESFKDFYDAIEGQQEGEIQKSVSSQMEIIAAPKPKLKLRLKSKMPAILAALKSTSGEMKMIPEEDEKPKNKPEELDTSQLTVKTANVIKIKLNKI